MSEAYERISAEILQLGDQYDTKVAELAMAQDTLAELADRIDVLEGEAEALNIMHAADLQRIADQQTQISLLRTKEMAYLDAIDDLNAEIKRLKDIIDPPPPPPVQSRIVEPYGMDGGGGRNCGLTIGKTVMTLTDVGSDDHYEDGWHAHKCAQGMSGARHMASITPIDEFRALVHGGAWGSQEGVYIFDSRTHAYTGPIAGSKALEVHSQNCNPTDGGWPEWGVAHRYVRSCGRLTWMRQNGSLVCGTFGLKGPGTAGVATLINGTKRVLPGTEEWSVRHVERVSDQNYLVSTWKSTLGILRSPGGLWMVNVDTGALQRMWTDVPEVERVRFVGGATFAAARYQGIIRDGVNITGNLPRAWWYATDVAPDGSIQAGCAEPAKGPDGRYWSWAYLPAGSTTWQNWTPRQLTGPTDPGFEAIEGGYKFTAVQRSNTLGMSGAIVTDCGWRDGTPWAIASGILWARIDGDTRPAPWGAGILVDKVYDESPGGMAAFAVSDFRLALCRDIRTNVWTIPQGVPGANEGGDVSFAGEDLHYLGIDGARGVLRAGSNTMSAASGALPPKRPQPGHPSPATLAEHNAHPAVVRFGPHKTYWRDDTTAIIYDHGAAISRMVGGVSFTLIPGDCIEAMQAMAESSVDAIVTDPPAGIGFMGKAWDHNRGGRDAWVCWFAEVGSEMLRVLKPGGHAFVWAIPRTSYWTAWALDESGFEIRDRVAHMFGSGFPKSLNVGDGWGTALKPAMEDWWLARKPLSERNVAANVQRWGTGAINVDGCRIGGGGQLKWETPRGMGSPTSFADDAWTQAQGRPYADATENAQGRWPANVTMDETAAAMLDEQTGEMAGSDRPRLRRRMTSKGIEGGGYGQGAAGPSEPQIEEWGAGYGDKGGASRFFKIVESGGDEANGEASSEAHRRGSDGPGLAPTKGDAEAAAPGSATRFRYVPKADREERNRGLGHMAPIVRNITEGHGRGAVNTSKVADDGIRTNHPTANVHPTVKPVELMRWLCRMVTPKGGTVLDPFTGSGSTGVAAMREGFEFIGIEREAEYVEIARARIIGDAPLFNLEAVGGGPTE